MRSIARYGWIPDRPDKRDVRFCASPAVDVPATPDWSQGLPPAFDQGQIGSCTGNMFAAESFFLQAKQGGPASMASRLFSYWIARAREGSTGSDAGAQIRDIIAGAVTEGICPEDIWPYDVTQVLREPSAAAFERAQYCEVLDYERVDNTREAEFVSAMMAGPLCFGVTLFDSFEGPDVARTGMVPVPDFSTEAIVGGHAMWLCQLDLVRRLAKVRNSWSSRWGREGYCWFPMDYLTDGDLATDFWRVKLVS